MISNGTLWPALGVLALGVGVGVQLGESAIGDINPVHFQGAAARPRAVQPPAPVPPSAFAQAYGWEEGAAARTADSGYEDFDFAPPPLEPRRVAAVDQPWLETEPQLSLAPWPPGQTSPRAEVERYTDFPVERKPEAETPPADPPAEALSVEREAGE